MTGIAIFMMLILLGGVWGYLIWALVKMMKIQKTQAEVMQIKGDANEE